MTNDPNELLLQRVTQARTLLHSLAGPERIREEDRRRSAYVDYYNGRVLQYSGRPDEAVQRLKQGLPEIMKFGDPEAQLLTSFAIGKSLACQGAFEQASKVLAELTQSPTFQGDPGECSRSLSYYAMALAGAGRYREALHQLERGLALAHQANQPFLVGMFQLTRAGAHVVAADWPAVLSVATPILEIAKRAAEKVFHYLTWDLIAWSESNLGQHELALAHRTHARAMRKSLGGGMVSDWFEAAEAEILLNAGRNEEAMRQAQAVVAVAQGANLPFSHAVAMRVLACAFSRIGGELHAADEYFQTAIAVAQAYGQVVNVALTEVWWGRILRERGHQVAAVSHFKAGIQILEDAGCDYASKQARRHADGQSI